MSKHAQTETTGAVDGGLESAASGVPTGDTTDVRPTPVKFPARRLL
jgi:hypothetical protein